MTIDGHELVVNSSIGISIAPRNGMDAEELLRSACTAMHQAKSTSTSNFLFYREDMEATDQDDLKMESELRKAIDRNELSLHYQPQVTPPMALLSALKHCYGGKTRVRYRIACQVYPFGRENGPDMGARRLGLGRGLSSNAGV